jgi:methionyl-tRNA formyltransferase
LKKQDGQIDWSHSARQIRNRVRALKPWPGTFTFWHPAGQEPLRLIIDHVSVVDESPADGGCGEVLRASGSQLHVATGGGVLSLDRLQPAGRRAMTASEFLRGHSIAPGDHLG